MNNIRGSLMIQGTTSDAGKSICVAGLCRVLKRRGISVAPFKPQNMALNSAVTPDGGEIGRAQALQAAACGLELSTDFNPVLLKPSSDQSSQVIIHGKAIDQLEAQSFGNIKSLAFESVLESYQRLKEQYDVVLIEGAGSPAEINLRENDIANMGFAEAVDCPVVIVGDINKGGIFAHLTGTLSLLSKSEQDRVKGFLINQFRGHLSLLNSGLDWLEGFTKKSVFGVIPFIPQLKLEAEDAIDIDGIEQDTRLSIKIPVLPRVSNHTDFDPLRWHPEIEVQLVPAGDKLSSCDLIIIPGTKNVRADLAFIKQQGWEKEIKKHLRYGGKVLGICGGFQMLGSVIRDPDGIEDEPGDSVGLDIFEMETLLEPEKQLTQVAGVSFLNDSESEIQGYEIHCGQTQLNNRYESFAKVTNQSGTEIFDGVVSEDNQVAGTYIHGLFESAQMISAVTRWVSGDSVEACNWAQVREAELERLADAFEEHIDIDALLETID